MRWFTWKRICTIGGAGVALFFTGFAICKLAGSEPGVPWQTGAGYSLLFGGFLIVSILSMKSRAAIIGKIFYGE